MKISSRTARIATAALLVGVFALGSGASPIQAGTTTKAPSKVTTIPPKLPRTKNGALPPVTTVKPKLPRTKNGALPTTVPPSLPKKRITTPSAAPKGS